MVKYMEDRWLGRRAGARPGEAGAGRDGQSQLTLGSFQSVHSNLCEKNSLLYTLLQHGKTNLARHLTAFSISAGVETTVDRSSKNNRIMKWIKQGAERKHSLLEDEIEEEEAAAAAQEDEDLANIIQDDIDIDRISP